MMKFPMNESQMIKQTRPSEIVNRLPKISTLIDRLEITTEEENRLITLVSQKAKYEQQLMKKANQLRKLEYGLRTK